eukprot:8794052-Pyramimonas_sp.AAC.1
MRHARDESAPPGDQAGQGRDGGEKMCPCQKKDAARLLRGQGCRSQAGRGPAWQALISSPRPLP